MKKKGEGEPGEWLSLLTEKIPCCSSPMVTTGGVTGPDMLLFVCIMGRNSIDYNSVFNQHIDL